MATAIQPLTRSAKIDARRHRERRLNARNDDPERVTTFIRIMMFSKLYPFFPRFSQPPDRGQTTQSQHFVGRIGLDPTASGSLNSGHSTL